MERIFTNMALAGAVTLAAAISLRAQTVEIEDDANVRTAIEGVFEHLEKDRVPTGLLLDYATDLVDLSYYDGVQTVDSNAVDAAALDYILRSIRSASVTGTKPFGTVSGIFETYSASGNDITNLRSANIGIAAFRYSYLPADALTAGRIDYVNGQVYDRYDADSTWINPYDSAYVFAFSPFDNYLSAGSVTFTFPAGAIFTNLNVISMEFDAGVGGGYVQVTSGGSVAASYSAEGEYTLRMRVTLAGGTVLQGHSRICITDGALTVHPLSVNPLLPTMDFISTTDASVSATVTIKHLTPGTLTKPLIVVEGFDPLFFYHHFGNDGAGATDNEGWTTYQGFIEEADSLLSFKYFYDNYDIIYVDWHKSEAPIQTNGQLLIDIINWVNTNKAGTERNIVLGQSMGGLVARYALRTMELAGTPHQTSMYVSYDSPHLGVNVPIGVQYLLMQLNGFIDSHRILKNVVIENIRPKALRSLSLNDLLDEINAMLNDGCTSANQMMYYRVNRSRVVDNTHHAQWQQLLSTLGMPRGDNGYGIVNLGYSNGRPQPYTYTNGRLTDFGFSAETRWFTELFGQASIATLLSMLLPGSASGLAVRTLARIPGKSRITVDATADAHTAYGQQNIATFRIKFTKKYLWIIPRNITICDYSNQVPSSLMPFDGKPGSYYSTDNIYPSGIDISGEDSNIFYGYDYSLNLTDRIMFVPTASALCINHNLGDIYTNSSYYNNNGVFTSAFDYCLTAGNNGLNEHIEADDSLYAKMIRIISNQAIEILGPDCLTSSHRYTLTGVPSANVIWTVDKSWASISADGVLSKTGDGGGVVTVSATWADENNIHTKTKRVLFGLPRFTLDNTLVSMFGDVLVYADSEDDYSDFIESAGISYDWGYRYLMSESIVWTNSTRRRFAASLPENSTGGFIYVYFKAKGNGLTSSTYSIRTFVSRDRRIDLEPIIPLGNASSTTLNQGNDNADGSFQEIRSIVVAIGGDGSLLLTDGNGQVLDDADELLELLADYTGFNQLLQRVKPYGNAELAIGTMRIGCQNYEIKVLFHNDL